MTAVFIVLGIIALITAVLLLNINLILSFDGKISVNVRILFVSVDVMKFAAKGDKKKKSKPAAEKKGSDAKTKEKSKPKGSFDDFLGFLDLISSMAKMLAENLGNNLKVNIRRLKVTLGAETAEKTAIMYSRVCSAVTVLFETLPNVVKLFRHGSDITIYPDYSAEKCNFAVEAIFTLKVIHILKIAFGALNIFNANTRKRITERKEKKA